MKKSVPVRISITILCIACLLGPAPLAAQQSPGPSSPSGQGITGGTAPIESTLFAYRALASDVDSVSSEILTVARGNKVVFGTAPDVAAFTQWRSIMGEALLLNGREVGILGALEQPFITMFNPTQLPPPTLNVTVTPLGLFTQGQVASFSVVVTNTSTTSPTTAAVAVTWNATANFPFQAIANQSAATATGWTCEAKSPSCSRADPLLQGASYSAIIVTVTVPQGAQPPATATLLGTATVTGGGAVSVFAPPSSVPRIWRPTITTLSVVPQGGTMAKLTVKVRRRMDWIHFRWPAC